MKKKIILAITILLVLAGGLLFLILTAWKPPSEDWWLSFDSIDELNQVRNLTKNGKTSELIEFVKGTNNGENVITSKKDAKHFLKILEKQIFPTASDWSSFSYEHKSGDFFISYDKLESAELSFIYTRGKFFDKAMKEGSENYTDTDVTSDISAFAKTENFDDKALRIGNGVEAFSFHRNGDEEGSIRETERGFEVRLSLNVDGLLFLQGLIMHPVWKQLMRFWQTLNLPKGLGSIDFEINSYIAAPGRIDFYSYRGFLF